MSNLSDFPFTKTVSFRTDSDTWDVFKSLCSIKGTTITTTLNVLLSDYNNREGSKVLKPRGRRLGTQGRTT